MKRVQPRNRLKRIQREAPVFFFPFRVIPRETGSIRVLFLNNSQFTRTPFLHVYLGTTAENTVMIANVLHEEMHDGKMTELT